MAWPDPRAISVGFAFGHTQYEDPTSLTYETVSPGDDSDPGPVLGTLILTRGRIGDAPETSPTTIDLGLRNENGTFSPRNATGPYYGRLRKGTPLEVAIDLGSGPQLLGRGAALGFTPTRVGPNLDPRSLVPALGLLYRLSQDSTVVSRMRLEVTGNASHYRYYYPFEDLADQFASGLPGIRAIEVEDVDYAGDSTLLGSLPLPVFGPTSSIVVPLVNSLGGQWHFGFLVRYVNAPTVATTLVELTVGSGSARRVVLSADATNLTLAAYDSTGTLIDSETSATARTALFAGEWMILQIHGLNSTSQVNAVVSGISSTSSTEQFNISVPTVGNPEVATIPASPVLDEASLGHLFLGDDVSGSFMGAADGGIGDDARPRIIRLALLAGIPADIPVGIVSAVMGGSGPQSIYRALRECEDADQGVLYELRDGRLTYQPYASRCNAAVALTLAFGEEDGTGDVTDLFSPDDYRDVYNQAVVSAPGGSFGVAERTDGPLGSDTTTGIGPRRVPVTRNLRDADDLRHHAGWIVHRGTIDRPRYEVVLDLVANPALASSWLDTDLGSRIQITGASNDDDGPDTLDLIIEGERIDLDATQFKVKLYCEPYEPFRVQQTADDPPADDLLDGWLLPDVMSMAEVSFVAGTDTTLSVDSTSTITLSADDVPFRLWLDGVLLEVTSVASGGGSVRVLTVTQEPLNGVHKTTLAADDPVIEFADPIIPSL